MRSSAAQRSMPSAIPPCGGAPYSNASSIAPKRSCICSQRVALQPEAPLEQVAAPDPDRAAAQLPAVERDVVLHRARPPGRIARATGSPRSPDAVVEQRLVLRHDAAERVVGRVPAAALLVPLVHREAVDPAVREHVGSARPRRPPSSTRSRPSTSAVISRASATTRIRSPSFGAASLDDRRPASRRPGTSRSARGARRPPRRRGGRGPSRRTASRARSARRSRGASRRPCRARRSP